MAHSCPDCGSTCYCRGDIDDCLLDFEHDIINCIHCPLEDLEEDDPLDDYIEGYGEQEGQ